MPHVVQLNVYVYSHAMHDGADDYVVLWLTTMSFVIRGIGHVIS